jgi:peptidoglycan/xylan/chitin deacetylase (PgdA/CDA1 family)
MRTSTMRDVFLAIGAVCGLIFSAPTLARAAECPGNPDALGTSRTLVVDPAEHPRLGSMQYHESLPLEDHEIVLTFDDGPLPPRSTQVLDILEHECVKATFFLIGKMARNFPETVRRIRDAGHTVGTHSYSHPLTFHRMSMERAQFEINEGIAAVTAALGDGAGPAPFFRVPGLLRADAVEHYLASLNLQVWSADFLADDWLKIGPAQVYWRALQRIEANHKGILLLHDIQARTVEALPYLLRELKRRGYRVVHVVPAAADRPKTATDPRQWVLHARLSPRAPIFMETEPELPVPSAVGFGFDGAPNSFSFLPEIPLIHNPAPQPRTLLASGRDSLPQISPWPRGLEAIPGVPTVSARPQLPAPSLQSLGYSSDNSNSWLAHKGALDGVAEARGAVAVDDIQRLLESLPEENAPPVDDRNPKILQIPDPSPTEDAASGSPVRLHGPIVNAVMPHGAFP